MGDLPCQQPRPRRSPAAAKDRREDQPSLTQRFPKLRLESNELRYKEQITIRGLAELRVGF